MLYLLPVYVIVAYMVISVMGMVFGSTFVVLSTIFAIVWSLVKGILSPIKFIIKSFVS